MHRTILEAKPHGDAERYAVYAMDLEKSFMEKGTIVEAVQDVHLLVPPGQVFGFLGPNGAGKTTTLRMLTTLLPINAGTAIVAGVDVMKDPAGVRRRIGYVGQRGGADLSATGWENLLLQGQLYGLSHRDAERRAKDLSARLELSAFLDRSVRTYSGGQRRRIELALGIMHNPQVLFLDEPTIGLDPQNRANFWDQLRLLREHGTTIFLTTHYLDEADALSDRLAIIDHGRVVAEGTPQELKQALRAETITITPRVEPGALESIRHALSEQGVASETRLDGKAISLQVKNGAQALPTILDFLGDRGVRLAAVTLREPSLDDVFLRHTGRSLRDAGAANEIREVA